MGWGDLDFYVMRDALYWVSESIEYKRYYSKTIVQKRVKLV